MKLELRKTEHPDYVKVHCWLRRKYGKSKRCESNSCNGLSKKFHWALKKGCDYIKDRNSFIQLCAGCHRKYDMTDQIRANLSRSKQGSKHPRSKLTEDKVREIKSKYKFRVVTQKMLAEEYGVCEHTIHYILKKITWKHV